MNDSRSSWDTTFTTVYGGLTLQSPRGAMSPLPGADDIDLTATVGYF